MSDLSPDPCTAKIELADKLLALLADLSSLKGVCKLRKRINAEKSFLCKVASSKNQEGKHRTTNLIHLEALISTVFEATDCVAVLESFSFKESGETKRITVDVVVNQGQEWIKVTARNPKGLVMSCLGDTHFGSRTILDQAADFLKCSSQNPVLFLSPKVTFKFSSGIDSALANKLQNMGINVVGDLISSLPQDTWFEMSDEENAEDGNVDETEIEEEQDNNNPSVQSFCTGQSNSTCGMNSKMGVPKLNLDITALIAYVSDMTNGGTCEKFIQEPLTLQAKSEQTIKVKECLDKLFEGKELFCCETAFTRFNHILGTVGGEKEKERAQKLLKGVKVIPDCVSDRVKTLKRGGQVKERAVIVFGTGDTMQAITVSANWGFCRSAEHQGVRLATFLHKPRALSEQASILSQSAKG